MADWNTPDVDAEIVDLVDGLLDRDIDASTMFVAAPSNPPVGAMRYLRASDKFQEWSGAAWVDKVIALAGGGTGGATAVAARAALGLGTIATQNSNAVAITGGAVAADLAGSTNLPASAIVGPIDTVDLGTGAVGAGEKFLADDQTFKQVIPSGHGGMWFTNVAPAGYVLLDGASYLRAGTMANLFAVFGTTHGAVDGTHFNVPDLRQRIPIGRNAATLAIDTIGKIGGALAHTHNVASHVHTIAHTHDLSNHTHTISHAHSMQGHTHTIAAEGLTAASPASGSFVDVQAGVSFTVTTANHAHAVAAHSHGGASGGPSTANTGDTLTANSGAPSVNATGASSAANSGGAVSTTDANDPPFFTLNFIVKY